MSNEGDIKDIERRLALLEQTMNTLQEAQFPAYQKSVDKLNTTVYGGEDASDTGMKGDVADVKKTVKETLVPKVEQTYRAMLLIMGGLAVIEVAMKFWPKK